MGKALVIQVLGSWRGAGVQAVRLNSEGELGYAHFLPSLTWHRRVHSLRRCSLPQGEIQPLSWTVIMPFNRTGRRDVT